MRFIHFPPQAEFVDRTGIVRAIAGCSLLGRDEFFERLVQLSACLASAQAGETWEQLYQQNKQVKYLVNRCLTLNGIDPRWLTFGMAEAFLLRRVDDDGNAAEGYLVELNRPKQQSPSSQASSDLSTLSHVVAALSLQTGSIEEALRLAATLPADVLTDLIRARAELVETAEQRQKRKFDSKKADLRATFERVRSMPVEDLEEVA